jgi:RNA polymerase subunit RPABC4/transcription elongation factor Spt4
MEKIRHFFDWVVDTVDVKTATTDDRQSGQRIYRCVHCGCTAETKPDKCAECRGDWFVRAGAAYESGPGFTCNQCRTTVDRRHECCPQCGSYRFDGTH